LLRADGDLWNSQVFLQSSIDRTSSSLFITEAESILLPRPPSGFSAWPAFRASGSFPPWCRGKAGDFRPAFPLLLRQGMPLHGVVEVQGKDGQGEKDKSEARI